MLFYFLQYIQPTLYFHKKRKGFTIFPTAEELPENVRMHLFNDEHYHSNWASDYDLSWQAIKKGYIGTVSCYKEVHKLPLIDEYRFVRKYFHPIWSIYILILRIFSFKNPFKEINAFLKNKGVKRIILHENPIPYDDFKSRTSKLIQKEPLVSVIIPTLNRYSYLKDVLQDFEKQTYRNFEIVIVDQSQPLQESLYQSYNLNINLVKQDEPALWLARNTAIKNSNGNIILLSEDDVRVEPHWIENHLKCLDYFDAQISAGVFFPEGSTIPKDRSFFALASQFATGNAALYKSVFKEVGLFDRQFERQRMGDGEFGLRCHQAGIKSISNPLAYCIDVKAGTGGLRQMGSWDAFRPKKWFAPRPIPSVLYFYRRYHGKKRTLLALLKTLPPSLIPYRFKRNKKLLILGVLIAFITFPLLLLQVGNSWNKASKKIKEGPLIPDFD